MSMAVPAVAGIDTLAERVGASALTVAVLVGLGVWAWRTGLAARERRDRRVVDVAVGTTLLVLLLVGASALLGVWGSTPMLTSALELVGAHVGTVVGVGLTLGLLATVYVGTGLVARLVQGVADRRASITEHQAEVVYRVLQVTIYVLAGLVALSIWSVELGGLLVGAGFLGIVVGMAARQTLGSLIAGFVLMFARPFEIGDWVEIGDQEGIVTDITIVNTRIQTFDGEYVMLPNDTVSSSEVVNRTRKGRLRLHVEVGVDYAADLDRAVDLAAGAMRDVNEILSVPQPEVFLKEMGDSAILMDLRFWIDKPSARRKWRAQTAVLRAVKTAFDEAGVKIPFPQRELTGREETGGLRMTGGPAAGVEGPPAGAATTPDDELSDDEVRSPDEGRAADGDDPSDEGVAADGDGDRSAENDESPVPDDRPRAAGESPGTEDD